MRLLCSLVVQQWMPLYFLPDGSRVGRLWLGWVLYLSTVWALCRHLIDITDASKMDTNIVLEHAQTMTVCEVSSQDDLPLFKS